VCALASPAQLATEQSQKKIFEEWWNKTFGSTDKQGEHKDLPQQRPRTIRN